ncbi:class A beta-lactamase-related serine hydrolase [Paenibacillaceae bacterium]|nr:class A beta-lactamase-related serine hydrolase [Paenibacillaceae bacterium]
MSMWDEWERNIENSVATNNIPGLAAGVAKEGQVLIQQGYGFRDREHKLTATAHTTFGIASITKTFTALAIMMLQEEGRLSIDDPVTKWLPALRLPRQYANHIQIRHLLNHTSGLPNLALYYRMMVNSLRQDNEYRKSERLPFNPFRVEQISSMDQFIDLFNESVKEWFGPPGINYSYSNEGYMFLDEIVSRASGQPYIEYVMQRIVQPLGMSDTTFHFGSPEIAEPSAVYYSYPHRDWRRPLHKENIIKRGESPISSGPVYGHGHLLSSAADLLTFSELFYEGGTARGVRLVSSQAIHEMIRGKLGLSTQKWHNGMTLVGHSGGQKGISSDIYIAVEAKVAAVAIANIARAPVWDVTLNGVNAALGRPLFDLPVERKPVLDTELLTERIVGEYSCPRIGKVHIDSKQSGLVAKVKGMKGLILPKFAVQVDENASLRLGRFPAAIIFNESKEVLGFSIGPGYYFTRR